MRSVWGACGGRRVGGIGSRGGRGGASCRQSARVCSPVVVGDTCTQGRAMMKKQIEYKSKKKQSVVLGTWIRNTREEGRGSREKGY